MPRRKKQKFAENAENPYVIEPGKPLFERVRGWWRGRYFRNDRPLVLEIGCGYGEYTVGLAERHPDRNFVGIDIKGDRLWQGATQARDRQLPNVAFLRTHALALGDFFGPGEVSEIWLTFPDPRPRVRDARRRLTHPRFLALYRTMLRPTGRLQLKTDSIGLFLYSVRTLADFFPAVRERTYTVDLYRCPAFAEVRDIRTRYEKLFAAQGFRIYYLRVDLGGAGAAGGD